MSAPQRQSAGRLAAIPVILYSAYFPDPDDSYDLVARRAKACLGKGTPARVVPETASFYLHGG